MTSTRRTLATLPLLLLLTAGCGRSAGFQDGRLASGEDTTSSQSRAERARTTQPEQLVVSLDRAGRTSPIYEPERHLQVFNSGLVRYTGANGQAVAEWSLDRVDALVSTLVARGFMSLQDGYPMAAYPNSYSPTVVSVRTGNGAKAVTYYPDNGANPDALRVIDTQLNQAISELEGQASRPGAQPAPLPIGWNPRSDTNY